MIFEQLRSGGCLSYMVGCEDTRAAVIVDPELGQSDRYLALLAEKGLRLRYLLDTHTHADHFSGARELSAQLAVPVVMQRKSAAPFVDLRVEDGDTVIVGKLRLRVHETPGHTEDSICVELPDRVLTGDTLLIGVDPGGANAAHARLHARGGARWRAGRLDARRPSNRARGLSYSEPRAAIDVRPCAYTRRTLRCGRSNRDTTACRGSAWDQCGQSTPLLRDHAAR